MAFVKNKQGILGQIPDQDVERAVKQYGYTLASPEDVQAERDNSERAKEAADHPVQAFGEGLVRGGVNMFAAPAKAVGGLLEAGIGPNPVSDATANITGDNALAAIKDVSQGWGGNAADVNAATADYMQGTAERAEANPISSGTGNFVGGLAGAAPIAAIAAPVGAATTRALGGGRLAVQAGNFAEGAAVGGIMHVADATDEAHRQDSYLRGEQAIAGLGLSALLGGGLNLAGKYLSDKYIARKLGAKPGEIPDLETPAEPVAAKKSASGIPDELKERLSKYVTPEEEPYFGMGFEKTEPGTPPSKVFPDLELAREEVTRPGGRRGGTAPKEPTIPDLEMSQPEASTRPGRSPVEEPNIPDLETSRSSVAEETTRPGKTMPADEAAFPRKIKYRPEARDLGELSPEDLPLGGRKGGETNVEELRAALSGEALNSRARMNKVNVLLPHLEEGMTPEDVLGMPPGEIEKLAKTAGVPPISRTTLEALADTLADRGGYAGRPAGNPFPKGSELQRYMDVIPEGADSRWLLDMSAKERRNLADFVGAGRPTEETWRALSDAVEHRAGRFEGPAKRIVPITPEQISEAIKPPDLVGKAAYEGGYKPGEGAAGFKPPAEPALSNFEGGSYKPGEGATNFKPDTSGPLKPSTFEQAKPFQQDFTGTPSEAAIGESVAGKPITGRSINGVELPSAESGQAGWKSFMGRVAKYTARRVAGRAIGSALGYVAGGPVGSIVGAGAGYALDRLGAFDKLGSLASKSSKLAGQALDVALSANAKMPNELRQGIIAETVHAAFFGKEKTPEQAYTARMKELYAFKASNGQLVTDRVASAFGPLSHIERGAVVAATQTAQRGIDYLLVKAPRAVPDATSLTPMSNAMVPNRSELNDFARVYAAVMDPKSVLIDIARKTVTSDQIEAIKTVYPQWYQENIVIPTGERLRERDAKGEAILPNERKLFDTLLSTNTGVDHDEFVKQYGKLFEQAVSQQTAESAPKPPSNNRSRKLSHKSQIAVEAQTQTNRILGPIQ